MTGIVWPLDGGRPVMELVLIIEQTLQRVTRKLLADTGAGSLQAPFHLLLDEDDCLLCGGTPSHSVSLGGAYTGSFLSYSIDVEIPALGFADNLHAVGISGPVGVFDGIACFRFLNRFTYGNFGVCASQKSVIS